MCHKCYDRKPSEAKFWLFDPKTLAGQVFWQGVGVVIGLALVGVAFVFLRALGIL